MEVYEQEGRTDWALAASKICWLVIWIMTPFSCFRFTNDLFGLIPAIAGVTTLLFLMRLMAPLSFIFFDEFLARLFPTLRSAVRSGQVRVYDFRVQDKNGRLVASIIKGDLRGGAPLTSDRVRLQGFFRGGVLQVTDGLNETTDTVISPVSIYSGWILIGTLAIVMFFSLYLWGTFDDLLYPLVINLWGTTLS
jgi:hypothetical protein